MLSFKESIKGWKHAHSDIANIRSKTAEQGRAVKLTRLNKDGSESGMHDASKFFASEEEAKKHHENLVKLNPNRNITHNLYVDGKHKDTLR